jgi:hypothetical protein
MEAAKSRVSKASPMPSDPMAQHACCKINRTRSAVAANVASLDIPADAMDCPYKRPSAEAARKFHAPETVAAVLTVSTLVPEIESAVPVAEFKAVRLPDRGGTHLRHCVFLI